MTESRITLARMYRGLNKRQLAEAVGVSPRAITGFEKGETKPSKETMGRIAEAVRFPISFFELPEVDLPQPSAVSFRARRKMSRKQRDQAISSSAFGIGFSDWLDKNFDLPDVDIPDLSGMHPEEAATMLRSIWGLGELPVADMISTLEAHGVRVFSVTEASLSVDAYSFWDENRGRPFVFLTTAKSGERRRMDAAHELGHLCMHRKVNLEEETREIEREADAFASAFLMPRSGFIATVPRGCTLTDFMKIKQVWKVSLAACVYRAHALGLLTDWQYRNMFKTMSSRGMRKEEPYPMVPERSQVATKVIAMEQREFGSTEQIIQETGIPQSLIQSITFNMPGVAIQGGGGRPNRYGLASEDAHTEKPKLTLVQ